eukprot:TRINITY_DN33408_c0_g1_i1.p1 TRINITY_DN33408_c0_g1~~TRINITY_DN33408_c0_g1_i1.p1  ORF type:complete len:831 (-),score=117.72 TRINITY_DN33408_c0_g1_i1:52-2544(-)
MQESTEALRDQSWNAYGRAMARPCLAAEQQRLLLTLLRAAADAEIEVEEARRKLCELTEFNPKVCFQTLQGAYCSKGWLSATDLHTWLSSQPHVVSGYTHEEVSATIALRAGSRELWYDDFLRCVLPNSASGAWLKELAQARSESYSLPEGALSPEVAYCMCQLLRCELEFYRLLRFHQQRLREVDVTMDRAVRFLDFQQGVCAGMGGLLSVTAVRNSLRGGMQGSGHLALSHQQSEALLSRINPSGAPLFAGDALGRLLGTSTAALALNSRRAFDGPVDSFENRSRCFSPIRSGIFDSPGTWASYATPKMTTASPKASPRGHRLDRSDNFSLSTPLKDGFGVSLYEGLGSLSPMSPQSPVTPLPDYLLPLPDSKPPRHQGQKQGASPIATSPNGWASPRGRGAASSYLDRSGSLSPRRGLHLPYTPSSWQRSGSLSPRRGSPRLPERSMLKEPNTPLTSTHVPSPLSSPRLHSPRLPYSSSYRPQSAGKLPRRSSPEEFGRRSLNWSTLEPSRATALPSPTLTMSPRASVRESPALCHALRVMLRQAQFDARMEESKEALPLSCTVEEVFSELDILRVGRINLTDVRRLFASYGAGYGTSVTYSSFGALVHEMHLRRKPYEQVTWPSTAIIANEQLLLRDIASLVLPVASEAYRSTLSALNDDEARSVLYLLKNSEPCPGCGSRIQRSAEAAGCPSVTCPVCGTQFQCFIVAGDRMEKLSLPLTSTGQYQVYRLLSVALEAAEEMEKDRRDLFLVLSQELCGLCDIFASLSGSRDRLGFTQGDLRHAIAVQGLPQPQNKEMDLLWQRYAPHGSITVNFMDFKNQLQPRL